MKLRSVLIMFGLLFGITFAQIPPEVIPAGVMPKDKRQAGTGVVSSSQPASTTQQQSSNPPPSSTSANGGGGGGGGSTSTPVSTNGNNNSNGGSSSTNNGGGGGGATTKNTQTTVEQASSTLPTTIKVTTTNADGSTVTSHISTNTVKSAVVQTVQGSKNSEVKIGSTTINPATLQHKTVITSALIGKSTEHRTYTSTWTSNGQVYSSVVTADQVVKATTGFATATIAPSLADGGNGGSGGGLSSNTKAVVGGVVGGLGGAALLGGLAFVAFRLWGKKNREERGDDFDNSPNDSLRAEKRTSNMTYATQEGGYRNPGGPVNTSSNF